jgi:hypothetical protein
MISIVKYLSEDWADAAHSVIKKVSGAFSPDHAEATVKKVATVAPAVSESPFSRHTAANLFKARGAQLRDIR